jgi:signal transduction histidine kinase
MIKVPAPPAWWPVNFRDRAYRRRAGKWALAVAYAVVLLGTDFLYGFPLKNPLHGPLQRGTATAVVLASAVAILLAVAWRAKRPVQAAVAVGVITVTANLVVGLGADSGGILWAQVLTTYSLVLRRPPRTAIGLAAAAWLGVAGAQVVQGSSFMSLPLALLALQAAAVAIALFIRSQHALVAAAQDRAEHAERERDHEAARAVANERVRIARELHDVVAHHVSLLVVQAGAVRETLGPGHPSREVLDSMIDGGRQAMGELRAMLGALRSPDPEAPSPRAAEAGAEGAPLAPLPSLAELGGLVEGARVAGLPIDFRISGPTRGLPEAVGLAAYRITQEALTNVVKHAPGASTTVSVDCQRGGVALQIRNARGKPAPSGVPGRQGQGLVGMRERAALCGGHVHAGPVGEGYLVEAWLPEEGIS